MSKRSEPQSPLCSIDALERRVFLSSSLVPAFGSVSLPASAIAGNHAPVKAPVVITNEGGDVKRQVITVNLFADTAATLDGNQLLVKSIRRRVTLKTDQTEKVNFRLGSFPATLQNGNYYLLAEVVDSSEATSVTATTQTVQVAARVIEPVVTVGAVDPLTIAQGKFATIPITIANDGNVSARGLDVTLAPTVTGLTPIAGIVLRATRSGLTIQPGKSRTFNLRFKITTELPAGKYFPDVSVSLGGISTMKAGRMGFTVE